MKKRPGRGRRRINPREFATTGPRTPETAANYLLHRGLRQDGSGDQRGVSKKEAVNASAAAIEHLPEGNAELLRFVLGDGVPLGHLAQLGDGFLQTNVPAGGGIG